MSAPVPFARLLRQELDAHVAALGRRRAVVPVVYVGSPSVERVPVGGFLGTGRDMTWRADLLDRALEGVAGPAHAWITRGGELHPTDDDLAWCAAALLAFARHGLTLTAFPVLTRHGWHDVLAGSTVAFHRIRAR